MPQIEIRPDMTAVLSALTSLVEAQRLSVDQFLRDPRSAKIIEFSDWAATENASDLWQKLFADTINRRDQRDFQFIFHLGDVAGKKIFEIDEVLDIIGDYSSYGKVSLILDTREADILWCRLNGRNADAMSSGAVSSGAGSSNTDTATARERYQSIFNTMHIDYLAVLQGPHVQHFSRNGQIQLISPTLVTLFSAIDADAGSPQVTDSHARSRFSIGCQLGVLLSQDCPHSVTLGLAVSGAWSAAAPDAAALLSYMKEWKKRINN